MACSGTTSGMNRSTLGSSNPSTELYRVVYYLNCVTESLPNHRSSVFDVDDASQRY